MKGIIIYDTSYGNTKEIAETIEETLKESGIEADLFKVNEVKKLSAKEYDFSFRFPNQIWYNELRDQILFRQNEE